MVHAHGIQLQQMQRYCMQKTASYQPLGFVEIVCGLLRHSRQMPHTCNYQTAYFDTLLSTASNLSLFCTHGLTKLTACCKPEIQLQGRCLNRHMLFAGHVQQLFHLSLLASTSCAARPLPKPSKGISSLGDSLLLALTALGSGRPKVHLCTSCNYTNSE